MFSTTISSFHALVSKRKEGTANGEESVSVGVCPLISLSSLYASVREFILELSGDQKSPREFEVKYRHNFLRRNRGGGHHGDRAAAPKWEPLGERRLRPIRLVQSCAKATKIASESTLGLHALPERTQWFAVAGLCSTQTLVGGDIIHLSFRSRKSRRNASPGQRFSRPSLSFSPLSFLTPHPLLLFPSVFPSVFLDCDRVGISTSPNRCEPSGAVCHLREDASSDRQRNERPVYPQAGIEAYKT